MKLDTPTAVGLTFCAVPVAVFSGYSQFETARMVNIPAQLAWVLFVSTDAAAYVATRVWLNSKYSEGIRRYAAFIVIICVALSIAGAALHVGLGTATEMNEAGKSVIKPPPAWLGFAVGAIPSLVLAGLIHLGALVGATAETPVTRSTKPRPRSEATPSPRPRVEPVAASAAEPVNPPSAALVSTSDIVAMAKPELTVIHDDPSPPTEISDASNRKARMLTYLDERDGEVTGAELDRQFGTKNYGARLVREWRSKNPMASGE